MLLAISIPVLRPVILYLGSPELLAICIFGLSMVTVLSGKAPLRGMAGSRAGADGRHGRLRSPDRHHALDPRYVLSVGRAAAVPVTLGLFALPELADLAIARRSIGGDARVDTRSGQLQGIRDTLHHWWLVLRCSWLGAALGAVPGLGAAVIDWLAYGHALKTEKDTGRFGEGDIRGVIASESSNNAKEGGALVPTLAFGVPGSASMAILLGAFMMHGLVPGPRMAYGQPGIHLLDRLEHCAGQRARSRAVSCVQQPIGPGRHDSDGTPVTGGPGHSSFWGRFRDPGSGEISTCCSGSGHSGGS